MLVCVCLQHANEDVEKMILGNKCDMADKRQVPRQKGEEVSNAHCYCHCYCLLRSARPGNFKEFNGDKSSSVDQCVKQLSM